MISQFTIFINLIFINSMSLNITTQQFSYINIQIITMTTEAIPHFLFFDERTDQVFDPRLSKYFTYDDGIKKAHHRFHSNIKIPNQLHHRQSETNIHNLTYSNKHGCLLINSGQNIRFYNVSALQRAVVSGNLQKKQSLMINNCGSIYLSPSENFVLILNQKQITIYKISKKITQICRLLNKDGFGYACWEMDEELIYFWKFQGKVHKLKLEQSSNKQFIQIQDIEQCSGISRNGSRIMILQQTKLTVLQKGIKTVVLQLKQFPNADAFLYQFGTFITMCKVNNLQKDQYLDSDIYAIVSVYYTAYDQGDEEPCHRYVYFLKGDLSKQDTIKVRGNEIVYCNNDNDDLYYTGDEDDRKKIGFSCISYQCQNFTMILIEKTPFIFMIDGTEKFEQLILFSFWPKHNFQLNSQSTGSNDPYMIGMGVMKNMLKFQKNFAADTKIDKDVQKNKTIQMISKQYDGQFMRLFFSHKETQCIIEFPLSVWALSAHGIYRKYAACTINYCENEEFDDIKKHISSLKRSKYIQEYQQIVQFDLQDPEVDKNTAGDQANLNNDGSSPAQGGAGSLSNQNKVNEQGGGQSLSNPKNDNQKSGAGSLSNQNKGNEQGRGQSLSNPKNDNQKSGAQSLSNQNKGNEQGGGQSLSNPKNDNKKSGAQSLSNQNKDKKQSEAQSLDPKISESKYNNSKQEVLKNECITQKKGQNMNNVLVTQGFKNLFQKEVKSQNTDKKNNQQKNANNFFGKNFDIASQNNNSTSMFNSNPFSKSKLQTPKKTEEKVTNKQELQQIKKDNIFSQKDKPVSPNKEAQKKNSQQKTNQIQSNFLQQSKNKFGGTQKKQSLGFNMLQPQLMKPATTGLSSQNNKNLGFFNNTQKSTTPGFGQGRDSQQKNLGLFNNTQKSTTPGFGQGRDSQQKQLGKNLGITFKAQGQQVPKMNDVSYNSSQKKLTTGYNMSFMNRNHQIGFNNSFNSQAISVATASKSLTKIFKLEQVDEYKKMMKTAYNKIKPILSNYFEVERNQVMISKKSLESVLQRHSSMFSNKIEGLFISKIKQTLYEMQKYYNIQKNRIKNKGFDKQQVKKKIKKVEQDLQISFKIVENLGFKKTKKHGLAGIINKKKETPVHLFINQYSNKLAYLQKKMQSKPNNMPNFPKYQQEIQQKFDNKNLIEQQQIQQSIEEQKNANNTYRFYFSENQSSDNSKSDSNQDQQEIKIGLKTTQKMKKIYFDENSDKQSKKLKLKIKLNSFKKIIQDAYGNYQTSIIDLKPLDQRTKDQSKQKSNNNEGSYFISASRSNFNDSKPFQSKMPTQKQSLMSSTKIIKQTKIPNLNKQQLDKSEAQSQDAQETSNQIPMMMGNRQNSKFPNSFLGSANNTKTQQGLFSKKQELGENKKVSGFGSSNNFSLNSKGFGMTKKDESENKDKKQTGSIFSANREEKQKTNQKTGGLLFSAKKDEKEKTGKKQSESLFSMNKGQKQKADVKQSELLFGTKNNSVKKVETQKTENKDQVKQIKQAGKIGNKIEDKSNFGKKQEKSSNNEIVNKEQNKSTLLQKKPSIKINESQVKPTNKQKVISGAQRTEKIASKIQLSQSKEDDVAKAKKETQKKENNLFINNSASPNLFDNKQNIIKNQSKQLKPQSNSYGAIQNTANAFQNKSPVKNIWLGQNSNSNNQNSLSNNSTAFGQTSNRFAQNNSIPQQKFNPNNMSFGFNNTSLKSFSSVSTVGNNIFSNNQNQGNMFSQNQGTGQGNFYPSNQYQGNNNQGGYNQNNQGGYNQSNQGGYNQGWIQNNQGGYNQGGYNQSNQGWIQNNNQNSQGWGAMPQAGGVNPSLMQIRQRNDD